MNSTLSQRKGSTASNHTPSSVSEDGQKDLNNKQTFTPFGASFPSRRSSTPAASFIPPGFWQAAGYTQNTSTQNEYSTQQTQQMPSFQRASTSSATLKSGNKLQQSNSHSGETYQHSGSHQHGFMNLPRRTSFGSVLGGNRLTAFTALGMGSGSNNQNNNPNRTSQQSNASTDSVNSMGLKSKSSFGTLPGLQESAVSTSTDSTPAPSMPSSPVQKPQKTRTVYLPGPDGICVESRSRRRSEA